LEVNVVIEDATVGGLNRITRDTKRDTAGWLRNKEADTSIIFFSGWLRWGNVRINDFSLSTKLALLIPDDNTNSSVCMSVTTP
jgi:hypothetical protein